MKFNFILVPLILLTTCKPASASFADDLLNSINKLQVLNKEQELRKKESELIEPCVMSLYNPEQYPTEIIWYCHQLTGVYPKWGEPFCNQVKAEVSNPPDVFAYCYRPKKLNKSSSN
jgi:hypothetical protein